MGAWDTDYEAANPERVHHRQQKQFIWCGQGRGRSLSLALRDITFWHFSQIRRESVLQHSTCCLPVFVIFMYSSRPSKLQLEDRSVLGIGRSTPPPHPAENVAIELLSERRRRTNLLPTATASVQRWGAPNNRRETRDSLHSVGLFDDPMYPVAFPFLFASTPGDRDPQLLPPTNLRSSSKRVLGLPLSVVDGPARRRDSSPGVGHPLRLENRQVRKNKLDPLEGRHVEDFLDKMCAKYVCVFLFRVELPPNPQ